MTECTICIANTTFCIRGEYSSTPEYFKKYRTEAPPAYVVEASEADRLHEQQLLDEEADREGLRRRVFTQPFLERAVIQRKTAAILLERGILHLHGSTVAADGRGYLFTAKTGVGKSTHTRLWHRLLGERVQTVNDDRIFLEFTPEGVLAYGSPWSGKHGLDTNLCVPLAGICLLERGRENEIRPISAEEALPLLLEQAFVPQDNQKDAVDALTERLARRVKLWKLKCNKELDAAKLAYSVMAETYMRRGE